MDAEPTKGPEILFAGEIEGVFSDRDALEGLAWRIHSNVRDALDAATRQRFGVIAVVMSSCGATVASVLKVLRAVNPDSRILLLARMHEEPAASRLVGSGSNGSAMADDYLICPVSVEEFQHLAAGRALVRGDLVAPSFPADAALQARLRRLEELATTDDLTGLKNRRYIREFARQVIARAGKENAQVTLLIFDIDDFKHYNDVYGHAAGDEILRQAAVLMRRCCRAHDVVGRIGGDEFAVVFWDGLRAGRSGLPNERRSTTAEHPTEPLFIAERFRKEMEKTELPLLGPEGKGVLTISGGLAGFPRDAATVAELFEQADRALLEAKRSGKGRIYLVGQPNTRPVDLK